MKKIIALVLVLAMLAPMAVFAEDALNSVSDEGYVREIDVIPDFDYSYIADRTDIIDPADHTAEQLWSGRNSAIRISSVSSLIGYPFEPLDGESCINAYVGEATGTNWYYISRDFDSLDLSTYKSLLIPLCCDYIGPGEYYATVILYSDDGSRKVYRTDVVESETWNGICCNISLWSGRSALSEIMIGVQYVGAEGAYSLNYQVDFIAVSAIAALARAIQLSSEIYRLSGTYNSITYSYDPLVMTVDISYSLAEQCYLTGGTLPAGFFASAETLKIRLANYSTCTSLTLEYATETQPTFRQNAPITVQLEQGNDMQVCYFPLPDGNITQLKITFDADTSGKIDFYSITPASYYSPLAKDSGTWSSSAGGISSCRISSDDTEKIVIKGAMTSAGASDYKGMLLQLYELEPYMRNELVFSADFTPIKTASVGDSFTFELPLYDGNRSRLNSRFIVTVYNSGKNQTVFLGSPFYITNPEVLAKTSTGIVSTSKKGFICDAQTALDIGVAYTNVEIDIGAMFTAYDSGISHEYNGYTYYFISDYIKALDAEISDLSLAGSRVIIRLILTKPVNAEFAPILLDYDSTSRYAYRYGFNVDTAEGVLCFEAACDFIARRYFGNGAEHEGAYGIIVGSDLDIAYRYYNLGRQTLRSFADNYCRALRIVSSTVKAVCSDAKIYIPAGNSWDGIYYTSGTLIYYARDLVDCISEQLRREGNIPCGYTFDLYEEGEAPLSDINAPRSIGDNVTVNSLPELCRYMKQNRLLCDNSVRSIIIIHDTNYINSIANSIDADKAALEYILVYQVICSDAAPAIECFIADDSFITGDRSDFNRILKYIDTERSDEFTSYAKALYGITDWADLTEDIRSIAVTGRELYEKSVDSRLPNGIIGSAGLWSFNSDDMIQLYRAASDCVSLENPVDYKNQSNIVSALFSDRSTGLTAVMSEFTYTRDLTCAPVLSFDFYAEESFGSSNKITLTVECISGGDSAVFTGSYSVNRWNTVVCDLSEFGGVHSIDGIRLSVTPKSSGDDLSNLRLAVGELTASSYKYESDYIIGRFRQENDKFMSSGRGSMNEKLVLALAIIIVAALSFEIIYILVRKRSIDIHNRKYEEAKRLRFYKNAR